MKNAEADEVELDQAENVFEEGKELLKPRKKKGTFNVPRHVSWPGFGTMFADEAHRLMNGASYYQALKEFKGRLILVTGTITQNGLKDLVPVLDLCMRSTGGCPAWLKRVCTKGDDTINE